MDIKKSKKGVVHTVGLDLAVGSVGLIVIATMLYFLITSGTAKVEKEIKAQSFDIRSDETLVFYLSSLLSKDSFKDPSLSEERRKMAGNLADAKITMADLIIIINENDNLDYRDILRVQTENMLNTTLGNEKWKLDIQYPDGREISFGGFKGKTRIFELKLPSTGYQLVNVKLTAKKEQ